jgi:hypothetical protein
MGFALAGLGFLWIILIIAAIIFLLSIGGWIVLWTIIKLIFKTIYWIFSTIFGFLGAKSQKGLNKIDAKLRHKRSFK